MTWTTFANLTGPTLPELDANFNILSGLVPIPCIVSGTNTLVLTSAAGAGTIAAYGQNMVFNGIAAATNTGAATAQAIIGSTTLSALSIFKDAQNGPIALAGSEIVANCAFSLRYDSALNASAGGFHLQTGSGLLQGQTVTLNSLYAVSASVSGAFSGASMVIAGGDPVIRFNSALYTLGTVTLGPSSFNFSTISMTGAAVGDDIHITPLTSVGLGTIGLRGFVSALGSIVIYAQNISCAIVTGKH